MRQQRAAISTLEQHHYSTNANQAPSQSQRHSIVLLLSVVQLLRGDGDGAATPHPHHPSALQLSQAQSQSTTELGLLLATLPPGIPLLVVCSIFSFVQYSIYAQTSPSFPSLPLLARPIAPPPAIYRTCTPKFWCAAQVSILAQSQSFVFHRLPFPPATPTQESPYIKAAHHV